MKYFTYFTSIVLCSIILSSCATNTDNEEWIKLFNGSDLSGWDTYLSYQPGADDETILGVNNDPDGIYSVVDGAIRINGPIWGALTSQKEFENYHLRLKFKWGEKKYPPRENELRDSGILYHCVGKHGAQSDHWMRSHESQIMEKDCGDYHSLDGVMIDARVDTIRLNENLNYKYNPEGQLIKGIHQRVIKSIDKEKPLGEWNEMEVIASMDSVVHIVNGTVVLRAANSTQTVGGKVVPLTKGRIQFQSEGAEIFYKDIEIKYLD